LGWHRYRKPGASRMHRAFQKGDHRLGGGVPLVEEADFWEEEEIGFDDQEHNAATHIRQAAMLHRSYAGSHYQ